MNAAVAPSAAPVVLIPAFVATIFSANVSSSAWNVAIPLAEIAAEVAVAVAVADCTIDVSAPAYVILSPVLAVSPTVKSAIVSNPAVEAAPASLEIKFPFITRWVIVQNTGAKPLKMGFTKNGVNIATASMYIPTQTTSDDGSAARTERLELRCKSLHFAGHEGTTSVQVLAGLTGLEEFPTLTGSDGFDGVG